METQENQAANIIIAELNAKIEEQKKKIESLQLSIGDLREQLKKEKIQHLYLDDMYQALLDKVLP